MANPIYPINNEYKELEPGTFAQVLEDWRTSDKNGPLGLPDRSFNHVWVRMFPIRSAPLGDPYPVTRNTKALSLANSGSLNIYDLSDGRSIASGRDLDFNFSAGRVTIDGASRALDEFWIEPASEVTTTMSWDGGSVRVELRGGFVVKKIDGAWSGINVVTVNDYLRAVVPSEVIASWHPETLRTQAIAARTYGLYEVAHSRAQGRDYDVDPTTAYQSYQGVKFWNAQRGSWRHVELASTSDAVAATGLKVITHNGELIKAFFSANSGGRTCTSGECFESGVNLPYLIETDDAPGIQDAPGGTWGTRANLTPATIKAKLREHGLRLAGTVRRLEVLERGPSGRVWRLRVVQTNGRNVDLSRLHTRKVMHLYGPIRSFQYDLGGMSGGRQSIVGHGYGHGVGMSQWGAQLFAKEGWDHERILRHYYAGVEIREP